MLPRRAELSVAEQRFFIREWSNLIAPSRRRRLVLIVIVNGILAAGIAMSPPWKDENIFPGRWLVVILAIPISVVFSERWAYSATKREIAARIDDHLAKK